MKKGVLKVEVVGLMASASLKKRLRILLLFSCEFREILKNTFFYRTPLDHCFCLSEKSFRVEWFRDKYSKIIDNTTTDGSSKKKQTCNTKNAARKFSKKKTFTQN